MGFRRLTSCLCCDLPTGALVIGIVYLVIDALGVIIMSVALGRPMMFGEAILEGPEVFDDPEPTEEVQDLTPMHVLFGLGLATWLVCAALDITLLVGTAQRRPRPLLVWVIGYCLVTAADIVLQLSMAVHTVMETLTVFDFWFEIWFYIVFVLAGVVGYVYLIAVVYSYYKELSEREERNGGHNMQPLTNA